MAKIGDLDRLVENLVGRGLVAPKFVGRQIGQSLIEELNNLDTNIATSAASMKNEEVNRLKEFQTQVSKNSFNSSSGAGSGSSGPAIDPNKPFSAGLVKDFGGSDAAQIVLPSSEGFQLRSFGTESPIAQMAFKNTRSQTPDLNTVFMGNSQFKTLGDVRNKLLTATKNPEAVSGFFG